MHANRFRLQNTHITTLQLSDNVVFRRSFVNLFMPTVRSHCKVHTNEMNAGPINQLDELVSEHLVPFKVQSFDQ